MSRNGKCPNLAHCVLAYRGETIAAPESAFVCPECQQPLTPLDGGAPGARIKPLSALILAVLIGLLCVMFFLFVKKAQRITPAPESESPAVTEVEAVQPSPTPLTTAPTGAPAPSESTASSVPQDINLDPQSVQNSQVKSEVLQRIDLMPTISSENKDKLYFSVERARQMGKIVKIPFGFGRRALSTEDIAAVQSAVQSERVRQILEDPTAVLVLLGYADAKGDDEKNLKISQDRAEAVLKTLRDQLHVLNVMHAVGMGSSTLFDESGNEKNRVVEVWVVLP